MPSRSLARLVGHLESLAEPPPADADLLARYAADRDQSAFAELVRRHGPAVLAVCRRLTGNREDAEDAFQAAFLALARKADRVQTRAEVGGWLFGAAVRTARKALARACRQRSRESPHAVLPDRADETASIHDPEVVQAVLEEIVALSAAYRSAVVLCELEGRPRHVAARELGIPEGTLSSRLAAARRVLARRLGDRGLAPAVLAAIAGAASCPVLAADANRLAAVSGTHSPRVVKLTEEIVRTPVLSKWLAVPAVALLAVGLVAFAAGRPEDSTPPAVKPVLAEAGTPGGRLLVMREDGFAIFTPDGKELRTRTLAPKSRWSHWGWLSPNGKQLAYLLSVSDSERQPRVMVRDLDGGKFATSIDLNAMYLLWAPDGKSLVATSYVTEIWDPLKVEHVRIDLAARTVTPLDWPDDILPVDWSADGKTVVFVRQGTRPAGKLGLMSADGKQVTELIDLRSADDWSGAGRRLSPDGKKLLFADASPEGADRHGMNRRLYVMDLATKKVTEVSEVPENATVFWACWSPDGKKIAYTWRQRHADVVKKLENKEVPDPADVAVETETFLIVADADGSNAKTITSGMKDNALDVPLLAIDWR